MKFLLFILSFCSLFGAIAQDMYVPLFGKLTDDLTGKKLGGVSIAVYEGTTKIDNISTASNGKYSYPLELDKNYKIMYSKPGYVTKVVRINTNSSEMDLEMLPPGSAVNAPSIDLSLFTDRDNVDFSFMKNEAVAEFKFYKTKQQMFFDAPKAGKVKKKIDALLKDAENKGKENEAKYNKLITEADKLFSAEDYEAALSKYEQALGVKPKESHPANRIVEIDDLLAAKKKEELIAAQANQKYDNLITAGNNLMAQKDYDKAISTFKQAAVEKPSEQLPKDKIKEINDLIKAGENKQKYDALIAEGDAKMNANAFEDAKVSYTKAVAIDATQSYPKEQLTKIEVALKAQKDLAEKKAKYEAAKTAGDALFGQEKYNEAKSKYEEALTFEPEESYPKTKLAEIEEKLKEQAAENALEEKYKAIIADADAKFNSSDYEGAIAKYNEALTVKTTESYPKNKIAEANTKIEELANAKAEKEKEEIFNSIKAEAENLFAQQRYTDAKAKYLEAKKIKADAEIDVQIAKIDTILDDAEKAKEQEAKVNLLMSSAATKESAEDWGGAIEDYKAVLDIDAINAVATTKMKAAQAKLTALNKEAEKEAKFNALKSEADALFNTENWDEAKVKYEAARNIKPDTAIDDKIRTIDNKLKELEDAKVAKEQLTKMLATANDLFSGKKYNEAIAAFNEVLKIDDGNAEATSKIALAEAEKLKIAEAEKAKFEFEKLNNAGITLLAQKKYEEAKSKFESALEIKEDEEVRNKLKEINTALSAAANEAEKEVKFDEAIAAGETLEAAEELFKAKDKYNEALVYKPGNAKAINKLKDLEVKISELAKKQAAAEGYSSAVGLGDAAMASDNYEGAIAEYKKALSFKPQDSKAKEKLSAAEKALEDAAKNKEVEAKYKAKMAEAIAARSGNELDKAISLYNEALVLKPAATAPRTAIEEINKEIQDAANAEKNKAQLEADYTAKMAQAQVAEQADNLERALALYKEASNLKPEESLPETKAADIEKRIEALNAAKSDEEIFNQALSTANKAFTNGNYTESIELYNKVLTIKEDSYARSQIEKAMLAMQNASVADQQKLYNEAIQKANNLFSQAKYEEAITNYEKALEVKSDDAFAQGKIKEAKQALAYNAEKDEVEKLRKEEFDVIVKKADEAYNNKEFLTAKDTYLEALKMYPTDSHSLKMVEESIKQMQSKKDVEDDRKYNKIISKADEYFTKTNYEKAVKLYNRALSFRSYDQYPKDKLKEIDLILNPPAKEENEGLVDLGNKEDISILEGQALLANAERERNRRKKSKVEEFLDKEKLKDSLMNYSDEAQRQAMSVKADSMKVLVGLEGITAEADRQAIVKSIDIKEQEMAQKARKERVFENSEIYRMSEDVDLLKREAAEVAAAEEGKYKENLEEIKEIDMSMSQFNKEEAQHALDVNMKTYTDLREDYRTTFTTDDPLVEYEQIQAIERSIQQSELDKYEESLEKQAILQALQNDAELLAGETRRKQAADAKANVADMLLIDAEIDDAKEKIAAFYSDADDSRQKTVENVKLMNNNLEAEEKRKADAEKQQIIENEIRVEKINEIIKENVEDDYDELQKTRAEVFKEQANVSRANKLKADAEEQALANTLQTSENAIALQNQKKKEKEVIAKANDEKLKGVNAALKRGASSKKIEQKKKTLATQQILDGFEDHTTKFTEVVANSLGEEFPEGVTQEVFVRNDSEGLPVRILTRRIVVVKGRGDVFIRIQNKYGLTYTKNGNSISKNKWINETESAKLAKHY